MGWAVKFLAGCLVGWWLYAMLGPISIPATIVILLIWRVCEIAWQAIERMMTRSVEQHRWDERDRITAELYDAELRRYNAGQERLDDALSGADALGPAGRGAR